MDHRNNTSELNFETHSSVNPFTSNVKVNTENNKVVTTNEEEELK